MSFAHYIAEANRAVTAHNVQQVLNNYHSVTALKWNTVEREVFGSDYFNCFLEMNFWLNYIHT